MSLEFEKVNELRSFTGSPGFKETSKVRLRCKIHYESSGGNSTEENYENPWVLRKRFVMLKTTFEDDIDGPGFEAGA